MMPAAVNEIGEPLRSASAQPTGRPATKRCRGAACPAFAMCQGRCPTGRRQTRIAPDGGVWIDTL